VVISWVAFSRYNKIWKSEYGGCCRFRCRLSKRFDGLAMSWKMVDRLLRSFHYVDLVMCWGVQSNIGIRRIYHIFRCAWHEYYIFGFSYICYCIYIYSCCWMPIVISIIIACYFFGYRVVIWLSCWIFSFKVFDSMKFGLSYYWVVQLRWLWYLMFWMGCLG